LFVLGSGPIKGFGVTLSIGVVASMISALIVARVLCEMASRPSAVQTRPAVSGLGDVGRVRTWLDETKPPTSCQARKIWLGLTGDGRSSRSMGIFVQGLKLGVEFTGGRQLDYSVSKDISPTTAREAVAEAGFPRLWCRPLRHG
jgi:SecD/SecF fusion protein